jgi:hypothetical protein
MSTIAGRAVTSATLTVAATTDCLAHAPSSKICVVVAAEPVGETTVKGGRTAYRPTAKASATTCLAHSLITLFGSVTIQMTCGPNTDAQTVSGCSEGPK